MVKKFFGLVLCVSLILSTMIPAAFAKQGVIIDENGNKQVGEVPDDYTPSGDENQGGTTKPDDTTKPGDTTDPGTTDPGTTDPGTTDPGTTTPTTPVNSSSRPSSGGGNNAAIPPVSVDSGSSSKDKNKDKDTDKDEEKDDGQDDEPVVQNVSYNDVPTTEWYYRAVVYVTQQGMMSGNNGNFSPNAPFTRSMMAQILYNMEGQPSYGEMNFPDVPLTEWYMPAVAWSSRAGYMSGYSNGSFGPNDPITREQLASILYRYAEAKEYGTSTSGNISQYSDAATTSDWAETAVRWAVGSGLLSGKTGIAGTRLDPGGTATRAEVAQILMNFGQNIAK